MEEGEKFEGFSQRWKDFPDYILGITHEIWESRGLSTLNHYYADDVIMRFPDGLLRGNQTVINGTMATIVEFPDRQLLGEDVIWSGDGKGSYLSSHRITTTGTHLVDGVFGQATGKKFRIRVIADCAAKNDTIYDEWLIRDYGGMVRQLGFEPQDFARRLIEAEGGLENCRKPFHPSHDVDGGYHGTGNKNEWGERYANILTRIMDKDFDLIARDYDRACIAEFPGSRTVVSHTDIDAFWIGLRSSFPSAKFEIHHQIGREDPMMPPRAAIRWSLTGKHDGWGTYGRPTGAEVHIMGLTHAEFGPFGAQGGTVRREYVLLDEVSIWKQIHMHTGNVG
ncbi:MAG: nuclear transport factor 2 family protein [Pseudomonadota bacterium]